MIRKSNTALKNEPEPRFPLAAVNFIDALLNIQRRRFNEQRAAFKANDQQGLSDTQPQTPSLNDKTHLTLYAEADQFAGSGWSHLHRHLNGQQSRWMERVGMIALYPAQISGETICIKGSGFTRKKFIENLEVYIDDSQISGQIKHSFTGQWSFQGTLPKASDQSLPFAILRLQTIGVAKHKAGIEGWASLAVTSISFE